MPLPVADPKRRSVFQAGSGQQQGPRISCTWKLNPPRPRLSPLHNKQPHRAPEPLKHQSQSACSDPPFPGARGFSFFLSVPRCSSPPAQPRLRNSLRLRQQHRGRAEPAAPFGAKTTRPGPRGFFWVYQEIPCGRAGQTHTPCNTTKHSKCCSAVQLQQGCGTPVEPKPVLTPARASREHRNAKKEMGNF